MITILMKSADNNVNVMVPTKVPNNLGYFLTNFDAISVYYCIISTIFI